MKFITLLTVVFLAIANSYVENIYIKLVILTVMVFLITYLFRASKGGRLFNRSKSDD